MALNLSLFRPFKASPGVVASFLGLAIFANVFTIYFVTQEHYVYFWDWSGYWEKYLKISELFIQNPIKAIGQVIRSIWRNDYNLIPVLPLVPFEWLFGPGRLTYILAITNVALLPSALVIGLLAQQVVQPNWPKGSLSPLLLAVASVLALSAMWAPVLRGWPDVLGIFIIGCILLLHFAKPLAEQSLAHLIKTGLLLCLLTLVRRWYAFWAAAFFPALVAAHGLDLYQRHGFAWRRLLTAVRNAAIIGLTFVLSLLVIAAPLALKAIRTDYSDIYSAYRHSSSLLEASGQIPLYFGWGVIICGLLGLAWLTIRKETRIVGVFLIIQALIIFWLFARTQDLGTQHYYLLVPGLAVGIAVMIIGLWTHTNRWRRAAVVGLVFVILLISSATVFYPRAAFLSDIFDGFLPQTRYYPLVRNDFAALERLLNRLEGLELDQPGDIYVLADSNILNSSILKNYCRLGPRPRGFCDHILGTHSVDKRDGFPHRFLRAHYLVVASPTQYHLRPEDQRIVGVLAREVMDGHGVGASFQRLPEEFTLDNEVSVQLFTKVRPLDRADVAALAQEFAGYYPDKQHLFIQSGGK